MCFYAGFYCNHENCECMSIVFINSTRWIDVQSSKVLEDTSNVSFTDITGWRNEKNFWPQFNAHGTYKFVLFIWAILKRLTRNTYVQRVSFPSGGSRHLLSQLQQNILQEPVLPQQLKFPFTIQSPQRFPSQFVLPSTPWQQCDFTFCGIITASRRAQKTIDNIICDNCKKNPTTWQFFNVLRKKLVK